MKNNTLLGIVAVILIIVAAFFITEYQTVSFWGIVTINDEKQDGSPNLQVNLNQSHTLETWVCALSSRVGSLNNYFYVYNPTTGESYRSPNIAPDSGCQWVNVEMNNIKAYDNWGIQYWKVGTNRGLVHYDSKDTGTWFSFEQVDPCANMPAPENICDGYNLWSQKCVNGEYVKNQLIESNSVTCDCVIESPENTCVGHDLWSQKQETVCIEGIVLDQLIESNSQDCGYICTNGETISFTCTDGTEIATQQCINNVWVDVQAKPCPLNWANLEIILQGYIEDMRLFFEGLL